MTMIEGLLFLLAAIIGFSIGWALFSARLAKAVETAIRLRAEKEALEDRLREQPAQVKLMASAMFEELSGKFSVQSEKQIGNLLDPLKNRLTDFHKLVTDSFTTHGKEQYSLKAEIEKLARLFETSSAAEFRSPRLAYLPRRLAILFLDFLYATLGLCMSVAGGR